VDEGEYGIATNLMLVNYRIWKGEKRIPKSELKKDSEHII
jgi:hypothetical protein